MMSAIAKLSNRIWHRINAPLFQPDANIVLLGDSMLQYTEVGNFPVDLEPWDSLLNAPNVSNFSVNGARIRNMWDYGNPTQLELTLSAEADFVLISIGANNRSDTDNVIRNEYITLGQYLQDAGLPFSFSIIYPCTEAYRDTYNNGFNTRIPEIINILTDVCDEYEWDYVDLRKQLIYNNPNDNLDYMREDMSSDGLHLNNKGYKEFSKAITRYLNTKLI